MKTPNEYEIQLENIKNYLISKGLEIDEVVMWQGGFGHEGKQYGCDILARCHVGNYEITYAVPKWTLGYLTPPYKEYHKMGKPCAPRPLHMSDETLRAQSDEFKKAYEEYYKTL